MPERAGGEPGRKRPRALAGWALAATALVAAGIYLAAAPGSGESIDGTGLRAKGQDSPAQGDALRLAVTNGAQVRRFEPGERLETGDKVGFFYSAGSRGFLTIFNVDPLVGATLLFPTHGRSGWVEPGVDRPLGAGAALGPAPWASAEVQGCEWIVAIFTPDERAPKDLARYLRGPDETNDPCRLEPTVPSARSLFVVPIRR